MIVELAARIVARFMRKRESDAERKLIVGRALARAKAEAAREAEDQLSAERLAMAETLFSWAKTFSVSREGRWAFEHWWRWSVGWDLQADREGRLWKAEDAHSFGRVPERLFSNPRELASYYSTSKLRDLVSATSKSFLAEALSREIGSLLFPRGQRL